MGTNRSNNMNIEEIEQDILGVHPEDTEKLIPPYDRNDDEQRKFDKAHRALRRSIQLKMRLFSMINAFYLGKILTTVKTSPIDLNIARVYPNTTLQSLITPLTYSNNIQSKF